MVAGGTAGMGHSKGRQSIVSSCSYTLLRDRSRTLLNLRILPSEHGGHPHPPVCEHMHTRPCPQRSPGIGVLVVTAVMQKFHHGLQGKVEGGWSQETGRGQQPSTPTPPPHTHNPLGSGASPWRCWPEAAALPGVMSLWG